LTEKRVVKKRKKDPVRNAGGRVVARKHSGERSDRANEMRTQTFKSNLEMEEKKGGKGEKRGWPFYRELNGKRENFVGISLIGAITASRVSARGHEGRVYRGRRGGDGRKKRVTK